MSRDSVGETMFQPPYFRNVGKRLVKAPKLYFLDTGLVCYLSPERVVAYGGDESTRARSICIGRSSSFPFLNIVSRGELRRVSLSKSSGSEVKIDGRDKGLAS